MENIEMKKISECPVDQAEEMIAGQVVTALDKLKGGEGGSELLSKRLSQYLGMIRAMHLWYHSAHHATRGASFIGDHASLFGKFYEEAVGEFDGTMEKAVGLTGDEGISCPVYITKLALQVLTKYPSPPALSSLAIAATALQMEKDYIKMVGQIFEDLEGEGSLTLGLNDFLMAAANSHETRVYLLQQRIKTTLDN